MVTLEDIRNNKDISTLVHRANKCLEALGYTDHGPRHVGYVSRVASDIIRRLGYSERLVELTAIAGWVHDIGNVINRKNHGQLGASMLFPILLDMGMPMHEVCSIISAVGNHEEEMGSIVSVMTAALVIADKIDAHKARVRANRRDETDRDIHDRVNFSIKSTNVVVDKDKMEIRFEFAMNDKSSVMEFMQIYMKRMIMTEQACKFLGCKFLFIVNGVKLNAHPQDVKLVNIGMNDIF